MQAAKNQGGTNLRIWDGTGKAAPQPVQLQIVKPQQSIPVQMQMWHQVQAEEAIKDFDNLVAKIVTWIGGGAIVGLIAIVRSLLR